MKKFIFSMFVCFLVSKVSAQVDTTKTYYPNGKIEAEVVYENNYRQGEAKFYWENGNLKETRIYLNDKVEGAVKTFYNNGQTKESYFIENSKR
ncbi:MAG: hypothetical protein WAR59_07090, partial [Ignavibacteriaceae bacterium]